MIIYTKKHTPIIFLRGFVTTKNAFLASPLFYYFIKLSKFFNFILKKEIAFLYYFFVLPSPSHSHHYLSVSCIFFVSFSIYFEKVYFFHQKK